jgi:short subunit dehydrogenase-like uncharacterized protein
LPTTENKRIAVIGAAGHTGSFVVSELLRRGFSPIAVVRDGSMSTVHWHGTEDVSVRVASIGDPASLDHALDGTVAVVNCAGPFLDTADAIASAALRARIHYFDVTAEQASAQSTFDNFDEPARVHGVVVLPAMGFYGGLIDLLLTIAVGDWLAVDDAVVAIALDSWHPTKGTRQTGRRNTVPRVVIREGKLAPSPDPDLTMEWDFPEPWGRQPMTSVPFSEVPLIVRHLRVMNQTTYLNDLAIRDVVDPATPGPEAADAAGRSSQLFVVEVRARSGEHTHLVSLTGRDIYAVTAPLVVEAVTQVLGRTDGIGGAFAPGQILDAHAVLRALQPTSLRLELAT